jgi:hypothetical protein
VYMFRERTTQEVVHTEQEAQNLVGRPHVIIGPVIPQLSHAPRTVVYRGRCWSADQPAALGRVQRQSKRHYV